MCIFYIQIYSFAIYSYVVKKTLNKIFDKSKMYLES
jgi:hypothetical protein